MASSSVLVNMLGMENTLLCQFRKHTHTHSSDNFDFDMCIGENNNIPGVIPVYWEEMIKYCFRLCNSTYHCI